MLAAVKYLRPQTVAKSTFVTTEPCLLRGNVLALWIFYFHLKVSRPNTVYLLNLVMADFLLLIGLPFQIDTYRRNTWIFGRALCHINLFMLAVNRSASIAFMTIIAVDRYFKVVHPHHRINQLTVQHARLIVGGAWTLLVSLRLPLLVSPVYEERDNISQCYSFGHTGRLPLGIRLHYIVYVGEFFLPLLLMMFCSIRIICILHNRLMTQKKKKVQRAIRVVMVVMGIFFICFSPGIISGLIALWFQTYRPHDCASKQLCSELFRFFIGFTYMNSAMDPAIYCFSSSSFRNVLKSTFSRVGLSKKHASHRRSTISDG
ncbi:hydroxycarboxylic acid receptor 2-like [Arapaima gigas]